MGMRVHLDIDSPGIFEEYFIEAGKKLLLGHSLDSLNLSLIALEVPLLLMNFMPIMASFGTQACSLLLQSIDHGRLDSLHLFISWIP